MAVFSNLFILGYFLVPLVIGVYLLVLLSRFVKAHQRAADALERMAERSSHNSRGRT